MRLEGHGFSHDEMVLPRDLYMLQVLQIYLKYFFANDILCRNSCLFSAFLIYCGTSVETSQLCSGLDESSLGACAQLVFAPIDESFSDDAPLLPSGFRVIPLDSKMVIARASFIFCI
jgi:homeobox-leucine zipper protein